MIGNDVVDLGDADSRVAGHHPRFDDRVFTSTERDLIAANAAGERVRWLLWAAKESAYKAVRREDVRAVFSPSHFVVRMTPGSPATVEAEGRTFDVEFSGDEEHVHAIAYGHGDADAVVYGAVARLVPGAASTPSEVVRRITLTTLSRLLGVAVADLAIDRDGRVPTLRLRGRPCAAEISLSHHGRFVAFACRWPGRGWHA